MIGTAARYHVPAQWTVATPIHFAYTGPNANVAMHAKFLGAKHIPKQLAYAPAPPLTVEIKINKKIYNRIM